MPITSNKKIIIPEQVTDTLAVSLYVTPIFKKKEVSATVMLNLQPYRVADNGDTVKVGEVKSIQIRDIFAEMANDPKLAEIVSIMYAAIQDFVNYKDL
jgi:hypothetical protein